MSLPRKQATRLGLSGWIVLTILVALTQTAFAYQDRVKPPAKSRNHNKPAPTAFTYRGQLKEGSVPLNGTYRFRFALYTDQTGDLKLGVVIKDNVIVTDGLFTARLDFGREGSSANECWLEVEVRPAKSADPYTALSPRQRLSPTSNEMLISGSVVGVPIGFSRAADKDFVPRDDTSVKPASQDTSAWKKAGNTILLASDTDNVGIGTSKPIAKLDVAGGIHASDSVTVGNSVGMLSSASLNLIEVDNAVPLAIGFSNPMSTTPNPVAFANIRVGIGTTGPTNTLDVNGQTRIRVLPLNPGLNNVVVAAPNGVLFTRPANTLGGVTGNCTSGANFVTKWLSTSAVTCSQIFDNGTNVGIATTTPTQRLTLGSGNIFLPNANGGTDGNVYFGGITDSGQVGMRLFGGLVNTTTPGGFIDVRVNPSNLSDGLRFRVDANIGGAERMRITAAGNVGIGTAAPTNRLSVGNNTFQVDASGNLVRINNVPYSWPASQGAPNTVLTNNGAGVLNWAVASGGGVTGNCTSGANFVTKWSSTSAVTCSQIFDNATNVGIGTTAPNEKLEITGNFRLPASTASVGVIKSGANRFIHNFGNLNFFAGVDAGNLTMAGCCNTAVGRDALQSNTAGNQNAALGRGVLRSNTTGGDNTAVGNRTLENNTTGFNNTAVGSGTLINNSTGTNNIALGTGAGNSLTTGSSNIYIGSFGGAATESFTIRIGTLSTGTTAFVGGIFNTNLGGAANVVVTSNGQLGITGSSRRFKERIERIGTASEILYRLRPVSFLYKPEYGGRADLPQFGLIAEDVAKVAPELVINDREGQPYTVQYQFLVPMLLNEMQKKDREIAEMRKRLDALEKLVEGLAKSKQ